MSQEETDLNELRDIFEKVRIADEDSADLFWNALTYDQKCDAFHAVVKRLHQGELKDRGSYRWVLYDVFGFGPDMYVRGMNCGFMALHNSIVDSEDEVDNNTNGDGDADKLQ